MKSLLLAITAAAAIAFWTHNSRADIVQSHEVEAPVMSVGNVSPSI